MLNSADRTVASKLNQSDKEYIKYYTIWRCLKNFSKNRGVKFTTYLVSAYKKNLWKASKQKQELNLEIIEKEYSDKNYLRIEIQEILNKLSERDRNLLERRFYDNMTVQEIANHMNCSRQNTTVLIKKALSKFRTEYNSMDRTLKD